MMKRIVVCMLFVGLSGFLFGQSGKRPSWIDNLPETKENSDYYYRVTSAEERNYDKAYAKAFARAILESSWKLGVAVDTRDDVKALENDIADKVNVVSQSMDIPMNKVCEYIEEVENSSRIRVYMLWQVAKYVDGVRPHFDAFNKCK